MIWTIKTKFLIDDENPRIQCHCGRDGEMIDWTARRWHFLEIGSLSGRKEQGYGIKGGRESRFVERIGLSTEQSAISVTRSTICSCQARRPSRIQDFRDSPRPSCASKPSCACLHAPAYTYNNVTHIPRVRLFLLFRPVARGVCSRARGWFRQPERHARSRW